MRADVGDNDSPSFLPVQILQLLYDLAKQLDHTLVEFGLTAAPLGLRAGWQAEGLNKNKLE